MANKYPFNLPLDNDKDNDIRSIRDLENYSKNIDDLYYLYENRELINWLEDKNNDQAKIILTQISEVDKLVTLKDKIIMFCKIFNIQNDKVEKFIKLKQDRKDRELFKSSELKKEIEDKNKTKDILNHIIDNYLKLHKKLISDEIQNNIDRTIWILREIKDVYFDLYKLNVSEFLLFLYQNELYLALVLLKKFKTLYDAIEFNKIAKAYYQDVLKKSIKYNSKEYTNVYAFIREHYVLSKTNIFSFSNEIKSCWSDNINHTIEIETNKLKQFNILFVPLRRYNIYELGSKNEIIVGDYTFGLSIRAYNVPSAEEIIYYMEVE